MRLFLCVLVLLIAGQPPSLFANDPHCEDSGCTFAVHLDQDLFLPVPSLNEDRNYTMGLMVSHTGKGPQKYAKLGFTVLDMMNYVLRLTPAGVEGKYYSSSFALSAYTPDELESRDPIFDDRPYSSLITISGTEIYSLNTANRAIETTLTLGVLGLPLVEWGQRGLHYLFRQTTGEEEPFDPRGWDNQVSDGGEPTALYKVAFHDRFALPRYPNLDITWSVDASVGYYTAASAGFVVRYGMLDKSYPVWAVNHGANAQGNSNRMPMQGRKPTKQYYALFGNRFNLSAYNALLECQFRDSAHCLTDSQTRDFIMETSLGVGMTFGADNKYDFLWTCNRRSSEHRLATRRSHLWCGVNLAWRM